MNAKFQKHAKNHSAKTLKVFYAKTRSKKHQIFQKSDDFKNRLSCKGLSPCKGNTLCKMASLGKKLKMPKTCEKPFHKSIKVVLCKTPLEKTCIRQIRQIRQNKTNIRQIRRF